MIGGLYLCLLIGILGLIDIISGTAKHYLSHDGWCYKEIDINEFDNIKENSNLFLHYSNGRFVGLYKYVE